MNIENSLPLYDIAVIGGGINGVGIANDAAGRGLSVFLCEKDDFASHTSSASSKLIHGGLRYLEHYEFRLVHEALAEREVLMRKAPHIVWPLRFVMPHRPHLRPAWLIRSGLFLYDYLGKRETLAASKKIHMNASSPLIPEICLGFEYSDCAVDDSRLVILNAMQVREHGAELMTRTRCVCAEVVEGIWVLSLQGAKGYFQIRAKALVNATGPWVEEFIKTQLDQPSPYKIRQVQGSHLVVKRLYEGDHAYILQNNDRRIVFTIPYLNEFTLIGTTDQLYTQHLDQVEITSSETDYLLEVVNADFKKPITKEDIVEHFSGVRPLCDDESDQPSAITRDYTLALQMVAPNAPLLSVFGGKLTTYRMLAESAMTRLKPYFKHMAPAWTKTEPLPGGEHFKSKLTLAAAIQRRVKGISPTLATRWASTYGTRVWKLLEGVAKLEDMGEHFADELYRVEVDYLIRVEWVQTVDDLLWRRTKLGYHVGSTEKRILEDYMMNRMGYTTGLIA